MSENLYCKNQKTPSNQYRKHYDDINWGKTYTFRKSSMAWTGPMITMYEGWERSKIEPGQNIDHFPEPNPGA